MNIKSFAALALSLSLSSLARAEIVVIAHPNAGPLTLEQVSDLYLGKSNASTPVDQPENASIRADFYKKATGRDAAQVKATWSRIVFTGKGQPPKEVADAAAVKKAVASDLKAVGYIDKSTLDGTVKVALPLN